MADECKLATAGAPERARPARRTGVAGAARWTGSGIGARVDRGSLEPWLLGLLAGVLAALLLAFLPAGTDYAAHLYQRDVFLSHGLTPWNNLWYGGRPSFVTYSLVYYPLAAVAGIDPLAAISVAVAALGFALTVRRAWGADARWSSRVFAVVFPAFLLTGAFPFTLGTAFAMLALRALQGPRWGLFVLLSVLAAASSPLAFLVFGLVVLAFGLGERRPRAWMARALGTVVAIAAGQTLLDTIFASGSRNPFPVSALIEATTFCVVLVALCWAVPRGRTLGWLGLVFAAATVAAFLLPSALGEGVTRFRFVALPLVVLALSLRRWRPVGVSLAVVLFTSVWSMAPLVSAVANGSGDASGQEAYWKPAIDYVRGRLTPSYRVEVVDTERHWAAAYLPEAGIPLARGWFRQNDFPQNAVLYERLTPARYRQWLRDMAVRYVLLPDAPLDYSAQQEAALLRSGRAGLRRVFSSPHVTVFEVPHARPLVQGSGASEVLSLTADRVVLRARPGRYRVAIRASPHWQTSSGCLSQGKDGLLRLEVDRPGTILLQFRVGLNGVMRALVGGPAHCATTRRVR